MVKTRVRRGDPSVGGEGVQDGVATVRMRTPFIRRTIFTGGASLISAVGILASGVLVARLLGPEGTGTVSLATWVAITASMIAGLGLPRAIERFLPELEVQDNEAAAQRMAARFVYLTLAGILLTTVGLTVIWLFAWRPFEGALWVLVMAAVAVQALADYFFAYCRATQRFRQLAILNMVSVVLRLSILVVGSLLIGVYGAVIAFVAALTIPTFLALRLGRGGTERMSPEIKSRARNFTASAWLFGILHSVVWTRAEVVFIDNYWGVEAVGLYSAGLALATMVVLLPTLLTGAFLPFLSEKVGQGAKDQIQSVYNTTVIVICLAVLPVCMGMAGIAPALIPLLFGSSFEAAVDVAFVLAVVSSLSIFAVISHHLLFRFEKGWFLLLSHMIGLAVLIASGLFIIPEFGIVGAAWARGGVHGLVVAIEIVYARWVLGFTLPYGALFRLFAAAGLCGFGAYAVLMVIEGPGGLLIAIPVGALVYGIGVRLTGALGSVHPAIFEGAAREAPFGLERPIRIGIKLLRGKDATKPGDAP
jgi:O-antigen/teichoic acid export membrane protein